MKIIKKIGIMFCLLISSLSITNVYAEESTYQYSDTATSGGVTLKVEWNEPVAGEELTLHASASGGSGKYKFSMDVPCYQDDTYSECVADPTRWKDTTYTSECESHDFSFPIVASGTYYINVHVMDLEAGVTWLRTETYITVSDPNYPNINSIINNVVSECKTDSEYQTALNIHDWILDKMTYDNSLVYSSVIGAISQGIGTCQAYEETYKLMLNAAGIRNSEIRDTADGHTWNAVYLDGEWYQVDCTWDDSVNEYYYKGTSTHIYFGLTDELMALAHKGHTAIYSASGYGTRSTSLKDNYFVKSGEATTWANEYKDSIQEHLNNKETSFTISAKNASYPPSISGIYNGIIAYAMNQQGWTSGNDIVILNATGDATQFTFTASYSDSSGHVHTWNEGVITKKASCSSEGIRTYTCSNCGQTRQETIAKLSDCTVNVSYRTHVQDYGWQGWVSNGGFSGTSGQSKRLEGIKIKINNTSISGSIQYRTHIQDIGWQDWKCDGEMSGTSGQSKRLEAIQIKLTDELAEEFDVYYRVHAEDYGWLDWAKNGESAGTEGLSKRLEAIEIKLVKKGEVAPGSTTNPFVYNLISYRTHVQDYGWQDYVSDGVTSGTSGQSKRLEGINIKLSSNINGSIHYQTHVQDIGWQGWKTNDQIAGTSGQSKRLEAIKIKLTGEVAEQYDIYYRVHCQDYGWLGWAKNGEASGSEGHSKRLEAIEIKLVKKGGGAPGSTMRCFIEN